MLIHTLLEELLKSKEKLERGSGVALFHGSNQLTNKPDVLEGQTSTNRSFLQNAAYGLYLTPTPMRENTICRATVLTMEPPFLVPCGVLLSIRLIITIDTLLLYFPSKNLDYLARTHSARFDHELSD